MSESEPRLRPDMSGFSPSTASTQEILEAARWLEGKSLREIGFHQPASLEGPSTNRTKHIPGHVYESYFNLKPNSDPRPDFIGAGIELKSTGLALRADGSIGQKERISLRMLGTFDEAESWDTSTLRAKLDHLLIVFYGHQRGVPLGSFRTLRVIRWSPRADELDLMQRDWEEIRRRRVAEMPLSERFTLVLATATKGPGRGRPRTLGYALKQRFVHSIYLGSIGRMPTASIHQAMGVVHSFESQTLHLLHGFIGRTLSSVQRQLGVPDSDSKNAEATIIRRILGLPARGQIRESSQYGLKVKTVPISPMGSPLERMSFAAFRPIDLVDQAWEESDVLSDLTRLLLVPLVRPNRAFPRNEATIGRAFFWSPDERQLQAIRATWESYRSNVERGLPDDYPRASDGLPIFVNSHGRNRTDRVAAPGELLVMRRSFWLHPDVVSEAVRRSHPAWRGY